LRSGRYADEAQEALAGLRNHFGNENYYIADPARVNMLRALLLDAEQRPTGGSAQVAMKLNNADVGIFSITPENTLLTQQKDWAAVLQPGANSVQLRLRGDAVLRYQIRAEYYVPRGAAKPETLEMRIAYGTQQTKVNGFVEVNAIVINHAIARSGPVIAELGVPAGFYVLYDDLSSAQSAGQIGNYAINDNRLVISLNDLQAGQQVELKYRLIAQSPGRVRVPPSSIYPAVVTSDVNTVNPDVTLLVTP
jgi:hypothetical protein